MDFKDRQRKFLASKEWAVIRADLFHVRGKKCEACKSKKSPQVHHLSYERYGGDEEPDDLIILCRKCHLTEHDLLPKKRKKKRRKSQKKSKLVFTGKRKKKFNHNPVVTVEITKTETVEEFLERGGVINGLNSA